MFYGIDYVIDLNRDFNDRVTSIKLNGKEINKEDYYTIAMNNYRASNTSIYPAYEGAKTVEDINIDVNELLINYVIKNKNIKANNYKNYKIKY